MKKSKAHIHVDDD